MSSGEGNRANRHKPLGTVRILCGAIAGLTLASILAWKWALGTRPREEELFIPPVLLTCGAFAVAVSWLWHWFEPLVEMLMSNGH